MAAPLNPREIYLLERYGSAAYFEEMRDAWAEMLDVAERALQQFMLNLPPDYRSRIHQNNQTSCGVVGFCPISGEYLELWMLAWCKFRAVMQVPSGWGTASKAQDENQ